MTTKEFDQLREELHTKCSEVIAAKGLEYTRGEDDRLSNFKRLAAELDLPPEKVLWIFLKKHLDSINYAIRNDFDVESERFESRLIDARNYLDLLYGIFIAHLHMIELNKRMDANEAKSEALTRQFDGKIRMSPSMEEQSKKLAEYFKKGLGQPPEEIKPLRMNDLTKLAREGSIKAASLLPEKLQEEKIARKRLENARNPNQ